MMTSKGFTLLEILVVVAIIAILAAVSIPAYRNYTVRSKMTDALVLMESRKEPIEEFYDLNNRLPLESDIDFGLPVPVDNVVYRLRLQGNSSGENATIYVQLNDGVADISQMDGAFGLRATKHSQGGLTWSCINFGLNPDFLPQSCR